MLLELSTSDEPVWTYFDSQHKHILSQMDKAYKKSLSGVKEALDKNTGDTSMDGLQHTILSELNVAVSAIEAKQSDALIGSFDRSLDICIWIEAFVAKSSSEPVWQAVVELVKNITETMLSSLPNFWKIATSFMDGKFKKVVACLCQNQSTNHQLYR
jgi:exocyst complex component 2